jgi:4-amino-4-deoxy-L-arabinose transferase-like glycosyltransferase
MNRWLSDTRKAAFILFFIAVIIRFSILLFIDNNRVSPDETGYHRIAVNLVKGNGLSNQEKYPFEKCYFREPGYPFFLAGIYSVVNIFHPVQYIDNYDIITCKLGVNHPEILAARMVQALVDSISIVLLFLILLKVSDEKIAFLTALITGLFFNLAYSSVFLLRESIVVFLLLILNYFFIRYLLGKKKYLWLILIGIIIGLLILVFQTHIAILPIFFVLLLFHKKKLRESVLHVSFVTTIAIVVILPHCISVYRFYPDIRIFKTFGTSFTYEMNAYANAISKMEYYGILKKEQGNALQGWNKSSEEQFKNSFNGFYLSKADSLNSLVKEPIVSKRKLKTLLTNFRKSFFLTKLGHESGKSLLVTHGPEILIPLVVFPVLLGILGIIGLLFFWKQYLIFFLPFVVYLSLFCLLGSEYRRMIILQPFLIFFGLLFINKIKGVISIYRHK